MISLTSVSKAQQKIAGNVQEFRNIPYGTSEQKGIVSLEALLKICSLLADWRK